MEGLKTKEAPLGLQSVISKYSRYDLFIVLISTLLVVLVIVTYFLKNKRPDDSMSPSAKAQLAVETAFKTPQGTF